MISISEALVWPIVGGKEHWCEGWAFQRVFLTFVVRPDL